jgi:predicted aconitase with swiveling domain
MTKEFKGRSVIPGNISGECVVSKSGLNLLASFKKGILKKSKKAICGDQNNVELYNKNLSGKIVCVPQTIGSTTGGIVIQTAAKMNLTPSAFLFSEHIDTLAAAGVILSDIWGNKKIITIDNLGDDFLNSVKSGMKLEIFEDGTVVIKD